MADDGRWLAGRDPVTGLPKAKPSLVTVKGVRLGYPLRPRPKKVPRGEADR